MDLFSAPQKFPMFMRGVAFRAARISANNGHRMTFQEWIHWFELTWPFIAFGETQKEHRRRYEEYSRQFDLEMRS